MWEKGVSGFSGKHHTIESHKKMREIARRDGRRPPSRLGVKQSDKTKMKIKDSERGKIVSIETVIKMRISARKGEKSNFWRGGTTLLKVQIQQSSENRQWRSNVFIRDNFTCQICGIRGGRLNAHHIKSFSLVIEENNIKSIEGILCCAKLWDINNGTTLCESCHRKTDNFGRKGRIDYQKRSNKK